MSLILDALRKADRERQQQQNGVPGLDAAHARAEAPPRKLWPWALAIALVVLGLVAAVVWLALERQQGAPDVTEAPEQVAAIPANPQPAKAARADTPANSSAPADDNPDKTASSVASDPAAAAVNKSASQADDPQKQESDSPPVDDEVARLYSAPPPDEPAETVASRPAVTPVTTQATAPAPTEPAATSTGGEAALRSSLLAAHPHVGTIRDLPLAVQNAIPTLMYAAHEYRRDGASEVMINNQSLREGQTLGDLEVEVIAEDGVILRKGEHHFKLTAMSSWVNM